jgi:hypothetical protein
VPPPRSRCRRRRAEHGPQDIETTPGKRQHCLDVGSSFHTVAVIIAARGGTGLNAESEER